MRPAYAPGSAEAVLSRPTLSPSTAPVWKSSIPKKGVERNVNPEFGDSSSTLKLDYVEFPVLLVANLTQSETSAFVVIVGPSFGYNISAEESVDQGTTTDVENVESLDVDAVLGVEFEHIRSSLSIFGDMRFSLGLTPIFYDAPSEYADIKNSDFLLLVGLKFPLGGGSK